MNYSMCFAKCCLQQLASTEKVNTCLLSVYPTAFSYRSQTICVIAIRIPHHSQYEKTYFSRIRNAG